MESKEVVTKKDNSIVNIFITRTTRARLINNKIIPRESYNDLIIRMIVMYEKNKPKLEVVS